MSTGAWPVRWQGKAWATLFHLRRVGNLQPVFAAREFSSVSLLLCQLWTKTDGMYAPPATKKQAIYAILPWLRGSMAARMMRPTSESDKAKTR